MDERNLYEILGVTPAASPEGIREAFRELARRHHPDHAGVEETARFRAIVEAYATLADPVKRDRYNRLLQERRFGRSAPRAHGEDHPEPLVPEPVSVYRDFERYGPSLAEIRRRFRRNFHRLEAAKREGVEPLTLEIVLSPDEAARGGTLPIAVPVYRTCPLCEGTGADAGFPCLSCGAEGLYESSAVVELQIPPRVPDASIYEVPIEGLGIHNFGLRIEIRIGS